MTKKLVTCKKCGRNDLAWAQAKSGKFYLTYAEGVSIIGESGRAIKSFKPSHECLVREGAMEDKRMELILAGLITTTPEERAEAETLMEARLVAFESKYGYRPSGY